MPLGTRNYLGLGLLMALSVPTCGSPAAAASARLKAPPASSRTKRQISKSRIRHSRRRQTGQKVPTPERIAEIQQALAKDGSFTGTASGKFDSSTVAALKKFQDARGLNPTGKLDALTLQKLGLGSQTAGQAAPTPLTSSSSDLTSPRPAVPNE